MTASSACAEKPKTITVFEEEWMMLQSDRAFLTDRSDILTVKLGECRELLKKAEENPPECDGFPWKECIISALVGAVTYSLVD